MSRGGPDVKPIFTAALEFPREPRREAYPAAACGGNAALHRRIDSFRHRPDFRLLMMDLAMPVVPFAPAR
jgi:hypothetical protein